MNTTTETTTKTHSSRPCDNAVTVYHGTTPERVASILRDGLLAGSRPQDGTPDAGTGGIYVVTRRGEIAGRYGDGVVLTLVVPRRWLTPDVSDGPADEVSFRLRVKRVPPARIVRVQQRSQRSPKRGT